MTNNNQSIGRKAQEAGPLQGILVALLIVSAAGFAMFTFYDGMINNYATPTLQNESTFTTYQDLGGDTTENVNALTATIAGEGNESGGATDIILEMTNRGFRVLTDVLFSPVRIANSVINDAGAAFGVPTFLLGIFKTIISVIVLFAIIALIMKVRA